MKPGQLMKSKVLKERSEHPRVGYFVFVITTNPMHNFFLRLWATFNARMKTCNTMDDALIFLGALVDLPDDVRQQLVTQ